jgi:outer membrane receptor for ferrienterochelin and colicins
MSGAKHSIVGGINVNADNFQERNGSAGNRDNRTFSTGAYIQDTWDINDAIKLESGLRIEYATYTNELFSRKKFFVLPRVSLLAKFNDKLSSRVGGGLGYKLPTLFTERSESIQYQGVLQLSNVDPETSYGATADINFRTKLGGNFDFSFNHLFFYTSIQDPLVLADMGGGTTRFINEDGAVQSFGMETNAKFIYRKNLKLFLGYTYTNAKAGYLQPNHFLPLVPKQRLNSALIYEKENSIKLGLEAYYTGQQFLYNGTKTESFWEIGFMAEKIFPRFSLYINFENLTDTRQSNYKRVANDPHATPTFDDIWTHTEGFVLNGGVKVRF